MENEEVLRSEAIKTVAIAMMSAARTAPKARGIDNLSIGLLNETEKSDIANRMTELAEETGMAFYGRDAECVRSAQAVVLIGTKISPLNLPHCGLCGHKDCQTKSKFESVPCAFNTGDLGIALGSMVSIATDHRIDNRIMWTVGQAAISLKIMDPSVKICYGIPLSISGKSPFFDRK